MNDEDVKITYDLFFCFSKLLLKNNIVILNKFDNHYFARTRVENFLKRRFT